MSDPIADPRPSDDLPRSPGEGPPPPPDDRPDNENEDALDLLQSTEPTDDSPTVISKTPPRPSLSPGGEKPEDAFSGGLRGRRLAHFELIEPIGVGGMAAVIRSRDTQLDRLVALKILPPEMASDAENIRRFHQEARSAAKLDHENIARVFFCGEDQRLHFIAFEFVEGDNLRTILERRGRLPVAEALHYMLQVAAGLAHAARRGVVHRDIKPSNIIITPNGRAKLVDMGLARSLDPRHDMGLTQSGVTLGTFDYISPEQALEPRDADVRSDIYSLGCTFYHMLTGHPPVPEGTAAKKLHHHQHVKPPDPRQFVPDLPDEVAVILDRMMAKQPRDRYQSPEQLVHHLLIAARKLGAAAEVPEGVLAVEAALPNPPSGRPLLLAVVAAVAVVGLIFLLDPSPGPKSDPQANNQAPEKKDAPSKLQVGEKPGVQPAQPGNGDVPQPPVNPRPAVAEYNADKPSASDLAKFLKEHQDAREITIKLAGDLDLSEWDESRGEQGLLIANPILHLRPRKEGQMVTIRFDYNHRPSSGKIRAALTILSQQSTIKGIRFVLNQKGASLATAGLLFRGPNQETHDVQQCEFIQAQVPLDERKERLSSVLVETTSHSVLQLARCCFLGFKDLTTRFDSQFPEGLGQLVLSGVDTGGHDAITRRGPARIEATDCAFGPHAALFRLEGRAAGDDGRVETTHCSALLGRQSVVYDLRDAADAQIHTRFSLFSRPGNSRISGMDADKGAVLLRQTADQGTVTCEGHANGYHQLDGYRVVVGAEEEPADWASFQNWLGETKGKDDSPESLASWPWQAERPLELLEKQSLTAAFQVNTSQRELRLPPPNGKGLIGTENLLAVCYVKDLPELKDKPPESAQRELIVDGEDKAGSGHFPTLNHALLSAKPRDVILLRLNGGLKLDPRGLNKEGLSDLTIRADKDFHPVLTLDQTGIEPDMALFGIYEGRLRLENLEVRLQPTREGYKSLALVAFLGDGECVLKNCLITLDRGGQKTALAAAVLTAPGKQMKVTMTPVRPHEQGPRFALENCLVRGEGDLVWSRCGRQAEVSASKSLIALTGSLLNVETSKETAEAPAGSLMLQLKNVTTYLNGYLLRVLAGKDLKDLAAIKCAPSGCLFLPGPTGPALIHLEGSEEQGLKEKLSWERGSNAYGSFRTMCEYQPIDQMMGMGMAKLSTMEKWDGFSGEGTPNDPSSSSTYNVKLPGGPSAEEPFTQLLPSSFKVDEKLKGYGADPTLLPRLTKPRSKAE